MIKKLAISVVCALTLSVSCFASEQMVAKHFSQRSDYTFSSHHVGEVPTQFVGTYTYGESHTDKSYVKFTLDKQGAVEGLFERAGKLIGWHGSVVAIGSSATGGKKLMLHYTINRKKFGRLNDAVLKTMDSPGRMFITVAKNDSSTRIIDVIGHFENYVSFNQSYRFKQ